MDLGLEGRRCVVTGASRGIGLAVARGLASEGARVLLVARSTEALERAARGIGEGARALALDITDCGAPGEIAAVARRELGGAPEVLVNNAGTSGVIAPDELTDADWQLQWELNVMAPMRLMRELAPAMADAGWGRIVNVSSSSGKRPSATNLAYSVTKAGQLSLSRAFAERYAARGVLVNAVAPGVTASELWTADGGLADQHAAAKGITRDQQLAATAAKQPRGRFAEPHEIAAAVVFLCSEAAANVVGAAWSVDGGAVPSII